VIVGNLIGDAPVWHSAVFLDDLVRGLLCLPLAERRRTGAGHGGVGPCPTCWNRRDPTQERPSGFGTDPVRVVAGCDKQFRGDVEMP
jgi:hypothetical protein